MSHNVVNGKVVPQTDSKAAVTPYGVVSCSIPDNASVSERFGKRSTAMIEVIVPIDAIGAKINAMIWARLERRSDGDYTDPQVGLPKGLKFADADAKAAFVEHIESSVVGWQGYETALLAAENRLLGRGKSDAKGKPKGFAPRLVKAGVVQPTPALIASA